jgi:hypothetical protein
MKAEAHTVLKVLNTELYTILLFLNWLTLLQLRRIMVPLRSLATAEKIV